ncbi:hypothetical protein MD484_g3724, partial [Candolleomyces efflorescens]
MSSSSANWLIECSRALKAGTLKRIARLSKPKQFERVRERVPAELWMEIFLFDPDQFVPSRLGKLRRMSRHLSAITTPILFSKVYFKMPFDFDTKANPNPCREYYQRLAEQIGVNGLQWARELFISVGGAYCRPRLPDYRWVQKLGQEDIDGIVAAAQAFAKPLVTHGRELSSIHLSLHAKYLPPNQLEALSRRQGIFKDAVLASDPSKPLPSIDLQVCDYIPTELLVDLPLRSLNVDLCDLASLPRRRVKHLLACITGCQALNRLALRRSESPSLLIKVLRKNPTCNLKNLQSLVLDDQNCSPLTVVPFWKTLQSLTSLDISGTERHASFDWSILHSANICLEEIITREPSDLLLVYLQGYRGLRDLKFTIPRLTTRIMDYYTYSKELFTVALPAHAESLRSFDSIPTAHFDPEWLPHLPRLHRLENLAFTVVLRNEIYVEPGPSPSTVVKETISTLLSMKALKEVCLQPALHINDLGLVAHPDFKELLSLEYVEALGSIHEFFDALRAFTFIPGPETSRFHLSSYSGSHTVEAAPTIISESSTNANYAGNLLVQELGENPPMTDNDWTQTLYSDIATALEIEKFLNTSGEYVDGRWVRLPAAPTSSSELNEPLCKLVNSILEHLIRSDAVASRVAVDTHTHRLHDETLDGSQCRCSPPIVIKASGASFSCPKGASLGFSNIATCFKTSLDDEAEDYMGHLGNLTVYAKNVFVQQPNRFFFRSLVITQNRANLFHFDRSGVQYTPLFNIHEKPHRFIRLILGLCAIDERVLGLDDTVQWSVNTNGLKESGTSKTCGPGRSVVLYNLVMDEQPFVRSTLCGRGTICWPALNAKGERFIIRDYWLSGGQSNEFELLEDVQGLHGVCQMVSYEASRAQTSDFWGNRGGSAFQNRTATRIVMKAYGPTIENFSSPEQVLAALRDAIADKPTRSLAPSKLRYSNHFPTLAFSDLHVDFRLQGTRMFQSLMVLRTAEMSEEEIPPHDYLDDLEGFFWVFSYLVCFYKADGTPAPKSVFQAHPHSWLIADPVDAHRRKWCFLSLRGILCEVKLYMDEGWRVACADLFINFRDYMCKLADRKEELAFEDFEGEPSESGPDKFSSMLEGVDGHYNYVLGLFDEALKKTREAAIPTADSPQTKSNVELVPRAIPVPAPIFTTELPVPFPTCPVNDQSTVPMAPSSASNTTTFIATASSRGSKRRSQEAQLEDSPPPVKKQCGTNQV